MPLAPSVPRIASVCIYIFCSLKAASARPNGSPDLAQKQRRTSHLWGQASHSFMTIMYKYAALNPTETIMLRAYAMRIFKILKKKKKMFTCRTESKFAVHDSIAKKSRQSFL